MGNSSAPTRSERSDTPSPPEGATPPHTNAGQAGRVAVVPGHYLGQVECRRLAVVDDQAAVNDGVARAVGAQKTPPRPGRSSAPAIGDRFRSSVKKSARLPGCSEPISVRPSTPRRPASPSPEPRAPSSTPSPAADRRSRGPSSALQAGSSPIFSRASSIACRASPSRFGRR